VNRDPAEYTVRWFSSANVNDYLDLYEETFGVRPGGDYLLWKYTGHPLSFSAASVAFNETQFIGALGSIPKTFKIKKDTLIGTHELDMMVKKEYRNKGIFFKLFKFRLTTPPEREVSLSLGMNDRVLRAFAERFLGYRDVDTVPQFKRILDTSSYLEQKFGGKLVGKLLELPLFLAFKCIDLFAWLRVTLAGTRYELRKTDHFDERFDDLWEKVSEDIGVAVVRDRAYLNWRYSENPQCNYEIYYAEDHRDRIAGFVVFSILPAPHDTGVILELIVDPARRGAAWMLLRKALSGMNGLGSKTVVSWSFPHQTSTGVMRAMGFRMSEQNLFLQVRRVSEKLDWEYITDRNKWFISMGDNDFYYGCPI
jgi:hypothetical protein